MGDPNGPIGGRRALSYYLMHGINEFYLLLFHFIIFLTFVVKKDQPLPFSFCVHSRFFLWHFTSYHDTWPSFFIHAFFALSGYFMKQKKSYLYVCVLSSHESMGSTVPRSERETYTIYFPRVREHAMGLLHARARMCVLRNMGYLGNYLILIRSHNIPGI